MATGFRKNKENKKKVVAKVVDFPDFDIWYLGNRMSDSNNFFSSRICRLRAITYLILKEIYIFRSGNRAILNVALRMPNCVFRLKSFRISRRLPMFILHGYPCYAHKYLQRAKLLRKTSIGRRRLMHSDEVGTHLNATI